MTSRPPHVNPHAARTAGDRWLFGYADLVTLLLAVFASLYASGQASSAQQPTVPSPEMAGEQVASVAEAFEDVADGTESLPGLEVTASARGLIISLPEAGSFPAGRADLSTEARDVMADLAARLRDLPHLIRVEGHTDDRPIATAEFASNWDLSTARATRVVALLVAEGIDPNRLAAAGYAEYRPRLPNDSMEARARNRRVDIVVLDPQTADDEDPGATAR